MKKSDVKKLEKAISQIEDARVLVEEVKEALETYYDGKSDRWQESEAGAQMDEEKNELQDIYDELAIHVDELAEIVNDHDENQ